MIKNTKDIPATGRCQCGVDKKGWKSDGRMICVSCHRPLWMTMDTAPENGDEVLVYLANCIEIARYDLESQQWRIDGWAPPHMPKHWAGYWMPLPDRPKS
jgi:hypothetical protein